MNINESTEMNKPTSNTKLNILFVNSIGKNKWGGGEKWMVNSVVALIELGHTVKIAARKGSILEKKSLEANIGVIHIKYNTDFSLISMLKFKALFQNQNIDVAICCQNKDVRVAGLGSKLMDNGPKIISRQGVQLIKEKWKYKVTFTNLVDGIITNSNSLKKLYDSFGWWDNNYVKVIYNGITKPKFDTDFDYSSITKITKDTKVILAAGRLSKQKGFEYLVLSAIKAKDDNLDWKFFIAGEGSERKFLENLIKSNNLEDYVYLLGFQESIFPLFKNADIFILPSLYEGMPNAVLEAMLMKMPVIATPVNGTSELINNNETGLFVPVKNSGAIFERISNLCNNPKLSIKIADNAHNYVSKNFTQLQSAKNIDAFLYEVLQ